MKIKLFLGVVVLIVLGGCLKRPVINLKKIKHLSSDVSSESRQTKDNVTVAVKKFDSKESEEIFGTDLVSSDSIVPLQLSIENKSGDFLYLNENSLDFKTIDKNLIESRLKKVPGVRAVASIGTLLGCVSVPAAILATGLMFAPPPFFGGPALLFAFLFGSTFGTCLIFSSIFWPYVIHKIVDSEKSVKKVNAEIKEFIKTAGIPKDSLVVPDKVNTDIILFAYQKDLKDRTNITLFAKDQRLEFNLAL